MTTSLSKPYLIFSVLLAALPAPGCGDRPPDASDNADAAASNEAVAIGQARLVSAVEPEAVPAAPAAAARPVSVIVKVRGATDQRLAKVNGAAVAASDPALAAWLLEHKVRAVRPVHPGRARLRQVAGLSDAQIAARTRQSFSRRASRAPQDARPPDLSGLYVLDLGDRLGRRFWRRRWPRCAASGTWSTRRRTRRRAPSSSPTIRCTTTSTA